MEEPSVLEYLKSLLNPWQKDKIHIPQAGIQSTNDIGVFEQETALDRELPVQVVEQEMLREPAGPVQPFPVLQILSILVALVAQSYLEPPDRQVKLALAGFVIALVLFAIGTVRSSVQTVEVMQKPFPSVTVRSTPLLICLVSALLAFLTFSSHQFHLVNTSLWLIAIGSGVYAFWHHSPDEPSLGTRLMEFFGTPRLNLTITPWTVLALLAVILVLFFRFYRLEEVPGEMFSDHAEKLIDVADVLNGNTWTFFQRNTGREFIQMYLTAAVSKVFNTGLSFISLKIGTALAGLLALPFIYLLGKEIGNRWTGLIAFTFAGIAYWPNVISRIGLRFPLYPLFAAPVLYFLIRALRKASWNDFLLCGLALGFGLHGYSPMRFVPFVVGIAFLLYLAHPQSRGHRRQILLAFCVLAFISFLVFIPLLRYWVDDPTLFVYRSLTRMGTIERAYPQPVPILFFSNLWKSMIMFFYDNGSIWVHSVMNRPALSIVPAALFFLGFFYMVYRYIRKPNWLDLFMLVSVPLLMMPSILSLAFPDENPSLNRSGGAIIPVFIIIAIMLEMILSKVVVWRKWFGKIAAALFGVILLLAASSQDYDLVFRQFDRQFMSGAWNTTEIGHVIRGYVESSIGNRDSAYVVPFPYWVDTRLVGINAGYPDKDYALWPDQFSQTLSQPGAKLFIIKPEDQQSIIDLLSLYPDSSYWLYQSENPGKDFWVLLEPADSTVPNVVPQQ